MGGSDQRSQRSEKAEDVERSDELSEKSLIRNSLMDESIGTKDRGTKGRLSSDDEEASPIKRLIK